MRVPKLLITTILLAATLPALHHAALAASIPDTVYTDPDAGGAPLVSFISHAQRTLDGEVYLVSSKPVLAALEGAAARHVAVRINLEQHPYGTGSAVPQAVYRTLSSHGVQVRWTSSAFRYTHAKYLVADNSTAWIGTMNWTTSAFSGNREFGVLDTDPSVVRQAEGVFAADWAHQPYSGAAGALVLSPLNARATITGLIDGARHTLDLYAEEVQDGRIVAALVAAAHRGVRVRMVAAGASEAGPLRAAGVTVLIKTTPYIHAKAIVADGSVVFIGSENISATSLDRNRELGLVLRDAAAVRAVETAFLRDLGGAGRSGSAGATAAATPTAARVASSAPQPTATSGPHSAALTVSIAVSPNPIPYGAYPTVTIRTAPIAVCDIKVVYSTGSQPSSYREHSSTADGSGVISEQGRWHMESKGSGGTVSAACAAGGAAASGSASFTIG